MVVTVTTNRSVWGEGVVLYSVVVVVTVTTNRSVFLGVREWFITVLSLQCCHGSNSYHEPVSVFRGEGVVLYSVVITVLSW